MRQGFRKVLGTYGELTKEAKKHIESKENDQNTNAVNELRNLGSVIDWHINLRAKESETDSATQQKIFEIQGLKQKIFFTLKDELRRIANNETPPAQKDSRKVIGDKNKLYWKSGSGIKKELTEGQIISDVTWNISYHLDEKTTPKILRKRLAVERAKKQLQELLDEQIIAEESTSAQTDQGRRKAYEALAEESHHDKEGFGHIAERIVTQFLTKKVIDEQLPYTISKADVYQDVAQKIDFIIRRLDYRRGVGVEEQDLGIKGVQFTVNNSSRVQEHKKMQILRSKSKLVPADRIDDISLVTMDMKIIAKAYNAWLKEKPPGGPDEFLEQDVKDKLFAMITEGMEPEKSE